MNMSLQGRRIVVTRPIAQAGVLAAMIAERGGEAICCPLLEIGPADDMGPLQMAAAHLTTYAFVVFISPNAVGYGLSILLAGRGWPEAVKVAAIGPGTVAALAACGVTGTIAPRERFDSEALLALPEFGAAAVAGRRVLLMRGNGGRELLAETLRERGAIVDCLTCYRRSPPADAHRLLALLRGNGVDALTISSSEGLRNLWSLLEPQDRLQLARLPLFVPHARIVDEAAKLGLTKIVLTGPADAGILAGIMAFQGFGHE